METKQNPYLTGFPGPIKRSIIAKRGTAEEKAWLDEAERAQRTPVQQEAAERLENLSKELYGAGEASGPSEENRLSQSLARMFRTMNKRQNGRVTDRATLYEAARSLLWHSYSQQVWFETEAAPIMEGREDLLNLLHQLAHWLIGDDAAEEGGRCTCENKVELIPIRKSIYIYGPVGTGKSAAAIAAHYASRQLAGEYNTGMRLDFTSLDEMMVKIAAQSSLAPMEDACGGNMVLDEMRTEHLVHKFFGNDVRILSQILLLRHNRWKNDGAQTIITSNVPPPVLAKQLGDDRLTDRMVQQYQYIKLGGESFRRIKAK